jgi:hypothetical protein
MVGSTGRGPHLAALHSPSSIEIASMKAWSLAAWRLDATSRDCRAASAANLGERTSGNHT